VRLAEDEHLIQALAAQCANQASVCLMLISVFGGSGHDRHTANNLRIAVWEFLGCARSRAFLNGTVEVGRMTTLFAFLHHVAAFTLVSALAVELVLIRQELTLATARRLPIVDAVLGVSAGILLAVGLLRVFFFEKGADYYFNSHAFLAKLSIFIAVALLSIIPTVEFLSWRKDVRKEQVPAVSEQKLRFLRKVIHAELIAVVIILLCAAIMARGGWV